jgi:putative phosphoribosyl transferase
VQDSGMSYFSREPRFHDRRDAGRQLAAKLSHHSGEADLVVLALPRGGVPVAYEVARALSAPLDVFLVRKLGVPGHEELAMGAIASGGIRVLNEEYVRALRLDDATIDAVARREERTLRDRELRYRDDRPRPDVRSRSVILVDDGLATGATMRAAIEALRRQEVAKLIAAVPVAPPATCAELGAQVDEMVCGITPETLYAVGAWYDDFSQVSDAEVGELLARAPGGPGTRDGVTGIG